MVLPFASVNSGESPPTFCRMMPRASRWKERRRVANISRPSAAVAADVVVLLLAAGGVTRALLPGAAVASAFARAWSARTPALR